MRLLTGLLFFLCCPVFELHATNDKDVQLVSWHAGECDNSTDPDHLVNRITSIAVMDHQLHLTVNFKDNCCAEFNPAVEYRNDTLFIRSFVPKNNNEIHKRCACNCCFSIDLVVSNIDDTSFIAFFNGKQIVHSSEPYKVYPVKYDVIDGDTINRNNRYGVAVGKWVTYDRGEIKRIMIYPDDPYAIYSRSTWTKEFYPNRNVKYFNRHDSTESWYEDGNIKFASYKIHFGEEYLEETNHYFENGRIKSREAEYHYSKVNYVIVDSATGSYSTSVRILHVGYYDNGQLESLSADTFKAWYPDGRLKKWARGDTATEYYEDGSLQKQQKHWKVIGSEGAWRKLDYSLYLTYYKNGKVETIHFVRDEYDSVGIGKGYYDWKWDENGTLLREPKEWEGPLPTVQNQQKL